MSSSWSSGKAHTAKKCLTCQPGNVMKHRLFTIYTEFPESLDRMFQTEIRVPFPQSHFWNQFQALTIISCASWTIIGNQMHTLELNAEIYECASCHKLTEDLVSLMNHGCTSYVNGRWNVRCFTSLEKWNFTGSFLSLFPAFSFMFMCW